jgi:hypothetical protein
LRLSSLLMAEITSYESPPFDMLPSKIMSFYQSMLETANEHRKKNEIDSNEFARGNRVARRNLEEAVRLLRG